MRRRTRSSRPHLQPTLDGSSWTVIGHDGRPVATTRHLGRAEVTLLAVTDPDVAHGLDRGALLALARISDGGAS